jgi:predicted nucleic acid-binding protein
MGGRFLDSNILVYAFSTEEPRATTAADLLAQGGAISVQVLNEFVSVCQRKLRLPWREIRDRLDVVRDLVEAPHALTDDIHLLALDVAEKHKLALYDAMIVASALGAGCDELVTEDMQDGMKIHGVTIRNPFRG